MEKTALEWLEEQMDNLLMNGYSFNSIQANELYKQAKEKEKQVIKDAYWDGGQDVPLTEERCDEYYEKKFKK